MRFLGMTVNVTAASSWLAALAVFALGVALFEWVRRGFAREWSRIQDEIAAEIAVREAA
jgi:branched-chain amino acid transport system permease protein